MRWKVVRPALLVLAALSVGQLVSGAQARGGYASSGIGGGGFGGARVAAPRAGVAIFRGGSYGSSRQSYGGIGFGPGYGPGFGGARSGLRAGRSGYGYGYGAAYGAGYGAGYGLARGSSGRAGIAASPVLPPAVYSVSRVAASAARAGTSDPRPAGPLLIVIGDRR